MDEATARWPHLECQFPATAATARNVRLAFESVQLIVTDFLPALTPFCLRRCTGMATSTNVRVGFVNHAQVRLYL